MAYLFWGFPIICLLVCLIFFHRFFNHLLKTAKHKLTKTISLICWAVYLFICLSLGVVSFYFYGLSKDADIFLLSYLLGIIAVVVVIVIHALYVCTVLIYHSIEKRKDKL